MKELATIRNDVVGSLLRPAQLKETRVSYDDGRISLEELRRIEDQCIRAAVQFMLHDEYEAHEFGSFEDALRKAAEGPPDLLILDAHLLAAGGSAVVARARQAIPAAALLVVGGELQTGQAPGGAAPGIGCIPLPLRVESVRAAVATALGATAATTPAVVC